MAVKNNFYQWLELPVERFESNPEILKSLLDKKITEWNSHHSLRIQNRAAIYESAMREAISDAVKWKQIYQEYKKDVDSEIASSLEYVAVDRKYSENDAQAIADAQKISVIYVNQVAHEMGYSKTSPIPPKPVGLTLKDITPAAAIKNTLDAIQKAIEELGFADITELINDQIDSGDISLESSTKDEVLRCIQEIKKKWDRKSATDKKVAQKKSLFDRVCVGMLKFLEKNEIKDYALYIQYKGVEKLLNGLGSDLKKLGATGLQDQPFNKRVDDIWAIIGKNYKREDAKSILTSYCEEKGIGYPKPLPKIASCLFCGNSFEKSEPIQKRCPACGKSFIVICPNCKKEKNLLVEPNCDGMDLQRYPILQKKMEDAEGYFDRLALGQTKVLLNEIEGEWKGFPGSEELRKRVESTYTKYEPEIKKIDVLCEQKKYHTAKNSCDKLIRDFPAARSRYDFVYEIMGEVEHLLKSYQLEKEERAKRVQLLQLLSIIDDHPLVNAEKGKIRIEPVTDLNLRVNEELGNISVNWKSANVANTVDYHVLRSERIIANPNDGVEVIVTQNTSISDVGIDEGKPYFYAVYPSMGPIKGALCVSSEPVVMLKDLHIEVATRDSAVDVSWNAVSERVKAYYSENRISAYGQGTEIPNVTQSGFVLEKLHNGKTYYFSCFKSVKINGKEYRSKGIYSSVTPIEEIIPPEISKTLGSKEGEYILTHTNPQPGQILQLYYSDNATVTIPMNRNIELNQLQSKLKKLDYEKLVDGRYGININGKDLYVYPVICRGSVATVGKMVSLKYIKSIKVTNISISGGNRICFGIDHWPEGAEKICITYLYDNYPENHRDTEKRIVVTKAEYETNKLLEIPSIMMQKYYITLFAQKGAEYFPICYHMFDNKKKMRLEYGFSVSLGGKVSINIESETTMRPQLYFVVANGRVPLSKEDGQIAETFLMVSDAPQKERISTTFIAKKGMYAKLFSDDKSFQLIAKGDGKLK